MSEVDRPDPDAILARMKRDETAATRGKLKIFFGMSPGVGKTYAMLLAAREKQAEGCEVVVGIVETHGRKETEALLEGMPIMPRMQIEYRGTTLTEMDLDAILTWHPGLAVVDELAHTNAPGSRHDKRWQDVNELLDNQTPPNAWGVMERSFPIVGRNVGVTLEILARAVGARRIIELGSGFGYSGYWHSRAVGSGGELHLTDGDPENERKARHEAGDRATPLEPGCRSNCKAWYSYDIGNWHIIALNTEAVGGAVGLYITFTGDPRQFQFQNPRVYYYIALTLMLLATAVVWALERSRLGAYLTAIREDEQAAEALGIDAFRCKLYASVLSAFLTGLGGAFYAFYYFSLQPNSLFGIPLSVEIVIRPIVGGAGTLLGVANRVLLRRGAIESNCLRMSGRNRRQRRGWRTATSVVTAACRVRRPRTPGTRGKWWRSAQW